MAKTIKWQKRFGKLYDVYTFSEPFGMDDKLWYQCSKNASLPIAVPVQQKVKSSIRLGTAASVTVVE